MISACCGSTIKWHDICSACGEHTDTIDEDELVYLEQIEWEEHIQEVTGWSESEVSDKIEEVCRDYGLHADDDRQEAIEKAIQDIIDDAREVMLPEYVEKFKEEIEAHEKWLNQ